MLSEEKIKEIRDRAISEIKLLSAKKRKIITDYIKELENKKIEKIRKDLLERY